MVEDHFRSNFTSAWPAKTSVSPRCSLLRARRNRCFRRLTSPWWFQKCFASGGNISVTVRLHASVFTSPSTRRWQMKQSWEFSTDLSCRRLDPAMRYFELHSKLPIKRSLPPWVTIQIPTFPRDPFLFLRKYFIWLPIFGMTLKRSDMLTVTSCVCYLRGGIGVRYSVFSLCIAEKNNVDFVHRGARP